MTERTPQGLNVMLQSVRECRLTKNQVFRLWKCAVKDDDKLLLAFETKFDRAAYCGADTRGFEAGCEIRVANETSARR